MWRALLVLSLLVSGTAQARELTLSKRFDRRFNTSGWQLYAHKGADKREVLVALNRDTLQVETINPLNGETLIQDRLDTRARRAVKLETLSTSTGEFVMAFATREGHVELHALNDDTSFEFNMDHEVQSLSLIEGKPGEVYLAVTTRAAAEVFRRGSLSLKLIQRVSSKSGIVQGKLLRSNQAEVLLQVFNGQRQMHLLQLDAENKESYEILSFSRPASQIDGVLSEGTDFIMAMLDGQRLRFYIDSQKADTATLPANLRLGSAGWIKGTDGRFLFTAVHQDKVATRLSLYDPYSVEKPVRLGIADARSITDIGVIALGRQPLYFYVKDRKNLVFQNENLLSIVPNNGSEQITAVVPLQAAPGGERRMGVMLDGANGSRLLMVGLK